MFRDRQEAGELLALKLKKIIEGEGFVVVALLRGGIVLGKKISDYFRIPLIPLSVKKIGAPLNPELAIGAVTDYKTFYFDKYFIKHLRVQKSYLKKMSEIKSKEAQKLQNKFQEIISLRNKKVVIVDDGVATGATTICVGIYAKKQKAKEIILAIPVADKNTLKNLKKYFDRVICLKTVNNLTSVSQFYKYFPQITDEEVINYLV